MSNQPKAPPQPQILVVEDSAVFREMQGLLLRQAGFAPGLFEAPQAALTEAAKRKFDLVVIDYELPEMNGEEFMHALRKIQPEIPAIFVSGSLTIELAIKLSSQGVAGIFNKPANPKQLLEKISETLSRAARDTAVRAGSSSPIPGPKPAPAPLPAAEPNPHGLAYEPAYIVGTSEVFRDFTHRLWKVRDFRSALLLQGETGSPFELFARELAGVSLFRDGPVMVCDVAQFEPRNLIEVLAPSLLSQDAGTLIVTGVDELTTEQQKTLENLTTGRDVFLPFARRFRLVLAATPRLTERVDEGTFGETLFYKISSLALTVPTLRAMKEDIVLNSLRILQHHQSSANASSPTKISEDAAGWLEAQDWADNYHELQQILTVAADFGAGSSELEIPALKESWEKYHSAALEKPTASAVAPADPAVAPVSVEPTTNVRAAPAKIAGSRSLFRPSSGTYDFSKRLTDSIALFGASGA